MHLFSELVVLLLGICPKGSVLLLLSRFSRVQLCDPIDGSPPGSPIPGILQARMLEWVAISFSKDPPNHRYLFSDCMFYMMQCFAYNKVVSNFKDFFNCTNDKHRHLPVCSVSVCRI